MDVAIYVDILQLAKREDWSSFKITLPMRLRTKVLNSNLWPEGVTIRPFRPQRRLERRTNSFNNPRNILQSQAPRTSGMPQTYDRTYEGYAINTHNRNNEHFSNQYTAGYAAITPAQCPYPYPSQDDNWN